MLTLAVELEYYATQKVVQDPASRLTVQFHVLQLAVDLNTTASNPETVEVLNEIT